VQREETPATAHPNNLASRGPLGAAWVAAFLGVLLIIATAIWAAASLS
jgi:hypothetical protein